MKRRQRNGYLLAGGILAGFLAAVILLGLFWTPYDPAAMSVGPKLAGPSLLHPMGTDNFGRDILSRVMQVVPAPLPWLPWPSARWRAP